MREDCPSLGDLKKEIGHKRWDERGPDGKLVKCKRWARDWDCCRVCGETSRKHRGKGLCNRCNQRTPERMEYARKRFQRLYHGDPKFREKIRIRAKRWQMEHIDQKIEAVAKWRKDNPDKAAKLRRDYKRRRSVVELVGLGLRGSRIGRAKWLDGEKVWTIKLENGHEMEAVPDAILVPCVAF